MPATDTKKLILLAAGAKGKRLALPHARILLHQPWGSGGGQATDIEIQAREILRMKDLLNQILARHTDQPLEKIETDTDRDFVLEADAAKEYGIIDEVISAEELQQWQRKEALRKGVIKVDDFPQDFGRAEIARALEEKRVSARAA